MTVAKISGAHRAPQQKRMGNRSPFLCWFPQTRFAVAVLPFRAKAWFMRKPIHFKATALLEGIDPVEVVFK